MPKSSVTSQGKKLEEPFSLGFEGEQWDARLPGLYVPVGGGKGVAVLHQDGGTAVVSMDSWLWFDDLLMAASFVQQLIAEGSQK